MIFDAFDKKNHNSNEVIPPEAYRLPKNNSNKSKKVQQEIGFPPTRPQGPGGGSSLGVAQILPSTA